MDGPHCVYPFIHQWTLGLFSSGLLWVMLHYLNMIHAMNTGESQFLILLGIYPEVELLDNMVILFNFLSDHQILFHSSHPLLQSYQQCMRVPISPHSLQHLFPAFLIIAIPMGVAWYLIVGLCQVVSETSSLTLAGVSQWIESWPVNQKVAGSIPSQGTCLGLWLDSCKRQWINISLTH